MGTTDGTKSLEEFNADAEADAVRFLSDTLFSARLASAIVGKRPFSKVENVVASAQDAWRSFDEAAMKEAFDAHPRIGDSKAKDRSHSADEQRAALEAPPALQERLAALNDQYEQKFGYRFLVFAKGRSVNELMTLLEHRLRNTPAMELSVASREKEQINASRLRAAIRAPAPEDAAPRATKSPPIIDTWWAISLLYVVSLALLFAGPLTRRMWPLVTAIVVFTVWDLLWVAVHDADRNAQEMLDASTRARTYMSYFVAIYGAGIVFVLPVSDKIDRQAVLAVLAQSGAPGWLLVSPLVLCSTAMLFFPIKLGVGTNLTLADRRPTPANTAVLALNAWIQKVSTFVFVYSLLLIAASTWSRQRSESRPTGTGSSAAQATVK